MGYVRANDILPSELIEILQDYIQGEHIYIPKRDKLNWGDKTDSKVYLLKRNQKIYDEYNHGITTRKLAEKYYLSQKTIQKIIRNMKE